MRWVSMESFKSDGIQESTRAGQALEFRDSKVTDGVCQKNVSLWARCGDTQL